MFSDLTSRSQTEYDETSPPLRAPVPCHREQSPISQSAHHTHRLPWLSVWRSVADHPGTRFLLVVAFRRIRPNVGPSEQTTTCPATQSEEGTYGASLGGHHSGSSDAPQPLCDRTQSYVLFREPQGLPAKPGEGQQGQGGYVAGCYARGFLDFQLELVNPSACPHFWTLLPCATPRGAGCLSGIRDMMSRIFPA